VHDHVPTEPEMAVPSSETELMAFVSITPLRIIDKITIMVKIGKKGVLLIFVTPGVVAIFF